MNTKDLLRNEIDSLLKGMEELEIGTDEYKAAVDGVTKLIDRLDDMEKVDIQSRELDSEETRKKEELDLKKKEFELKTKTFEDEKLYKEQQLGMEKQKTIVNAVMTGVGIAVPTALTIWGTYKSFKFEETGSITTTLGRGFINRLLPKK